MEMTGAARELGPLFFAHIVSISRFLVRTRQPRLAPCPCTFALRGINPLEQSFTASPHQPPLTTSRRSMRPRGPDGRFAGALLVSFAVAIGCGSDPKPEPKTPAAATS